MVDPGTFSKFLLLYGPGGTGKTEVVNVILDIMAGCAGAIKASQLVDTRSDMSVDTAKVLASNRIVTTGEIDLADGKLNLHSLKEMTGHDSILIPPIRVATRCSIVTSSNNLPDPHKQPEWLTTAIARRVVVVPMNVQASLLPSAERPDTEEDNMDFLLSCVHTFLTNSSMPASPRSILYSILGRGYEEIRERVIIDANASTQDVMDANANIETTFSMKPQDLGELASLKSPDCVVILGGIKFLKGIRLAQ
ncbi:hypothetical protein HIM_11631 [Hirsutella minnesotensis 3608]|uniref:SF3 helicase domain-containing protein n=1 Tax=Hirsutella minnesotensis 3608 TaxID=1043627 RepID=A0A0F8A0Y2_9HYPO|nr:hypothetical protein HIM_11631 [Hirsutella minnesotensis 3608]